MILEVTKEMYLRQIGSWQTSMNDDIKQKYFGINTSGFNTSLSLKVGKKYLEGEFKLKKEIKLGK